MDVQRLFAELDHGKDGVISSDELTCGMLSRGMDPDDISALFRALDTDGDGILRCVRARQKPPTATFLAAGVISLKELEAGIGHLASTLGEPGKPGQLLRLSSNLTGTYAVNHRLQSH
jgi:hypothetical protein